MKIAIIGAGWAGLTAAIASTQAGHHATVFEASRAVGGRARALSDSQSGNPLDNGQHILVGAYTECLRLIRLVGVNPESALLRLPLSLPFVDGTGLQTPIWAKNWSAPFDALLAIATARGWSWADRFSLINVSMGWQCTGFRSSPQQTVADLCRKMTPRVREELIEPLCVSALNTPADRASATVFLRVLKDVLFGINGGSHLLLPRTDLGSLFPEAAARWLTERGHVVQRGKRVRQLLWNDSQWRVDGEPFDRVICATSSANAAAMLIQSAQVAPENIANAMRTWAQTASALHFEAIATVYAKITEKSNQRLPHPMLALRSGADAPAQFVFDRGQLGGATGLLAFVVSASHGSREEVQAAVLAQAARELAPLHLGKLEPVQTIIEKHATFACTPNLQRPAQKIASGLFAVGDYVEGVYPATLEGAVRSGLQMGDC